MATLRHRAFRRRTGFLRRLFIEPLEDRRLLAVVTLNPNIVYQTIEGFGTAAVYPTNLVTVAQAGAIMRDAGMTVVRVTPSAYDYTYTVGGSMSTPVPISENLDENVARFNPGDNSQVDLLQWLVANSSDPDRIKMIGSLWSPPHWMKITTGRLMNWDGQSAYDPIIPWGDYGANTGGVRWAGNEAGVARETEWSVIGLDKPEAEFQWPDMCADNLGGRDVLSKAVELHWFPAEANVSIMPCWFYHDDNNMKSADELMDLYEKSVGRNASFILNIPPDKRGLFTDAEVAALKAFGERRQSLYGQNLASGATATASSSLPDHPAAAALDGKYETYWEAAPRGDSDTPVTLEISLPRQVTYKRVVLQEQIRRGQRVESFTIEALQPDGQWKKLAAATTIGYKRIVAVPETSATHLRIRFDGFRVAPTIAEIGLYF